MTKVNKQFIEAMQKRIDGKPAEYDGADNPKNYKNMSEYELSRLIKKDAEQLFHNVLSNPDKFIAMEQCIDIANRCWMLWERLEATNG